jgi:hypothetical protein
MSKKQALLAPFFTSLQRNGLGIQQVFMNRAVFAD